MNPAFSWKKFIQGAKEVNGGFPFGSYNVDVLGIEMGERKGADGNKAFYIDFIVRINKKLDPSAHGAERVTLKGAGICSFKMGNDLQDGKLVSMLAASAGYWKDDGTVDFQRFQGTSDESSERFDTHMANLADGKIIANMDLRVEQQSGSNYRNFIAYKAGTMPDAMKIVTVSEVIRTDKTDKKEPNAKESAKAETPF